MSTSRLVSGFLEHGERGAKLAIGLPGAGGFITYQNLLPRVRWLQGKLPFDVYFMGETGEVTVVGVPGAR